MTPIREKNKHEWQLHTCFHCDYITEKKCQQCANEWGQTSDKTGPDYYPHDGNNDTKKSENTQKISNTCQEATRNTDSPKTHRQKNDKKYEKNKGINKQRAIPRFRRERPIQPRPIKQSNLPPHSPARRRECLQTPRPSLARPVYKPGEMQRAILPSHCIPSAKSTRSFTQKATHAFLLLLLIHRST